MLWPYRLNHCRADHRHAEAALVYGTSRAVVGYWLQLPDKLIRSTNRMLVRRLPQILPSGRKHGRARPGFSRGVHRKAQTYVRWVADQGLGYELQKGTSREVLSGGTYIPSRLSAKLQSAD